MGYTSDANGIHYAGNIGGSSSTFEEAKNLCWCRVVLLVNYRLQLVRNDRIERKTNSLICRDDVDED